MFDGGDIPQRQEGSRPRVAHFFLLMRCGLKFLTKYAHEVHSHSLPHWASLPATSLLQDGSSLPESESHSKAAPCVDLSRARQRLLGDQTPGPLLPLPLNTGQATAPDCPLGTERSRHAWAEVQGSGLCIWFLEKGKVCRSGF